MPSPNFTEAFRWVAAMGLLLTACESEPPPKARQRPAVTASAAASVRTQLQRLQEAMAAAPVSSIAPASSESPEPAEAEEALVGKSRKRPSPFRVGQRSVVVDQLVDIGPAGPSSATAGGVLLLRRDGTPAFALLDRTLSPDTYAMKRPGATPIASLNVDPRDLVALEHGPVVTGTTAYFVHGSHLFRRPLTATKTESLADDARAYTRVAIADEPHRDRPLVVGYIAKHPTEMDTLVAKVWVEGQGTFLLTPDGSTGNSVALARTADGYLAVSLESRTGMSPLHARRISFEGHKVRLGPDVVPWVAGTAQSLTEIFAVSSPEGAYAFLPIERDATHFGLARIDIGTFPKLGCPVHWREYPNGLSPAVVTVGHLCGEPVVLYARPATAEPHATQELHLAAVGDEGLSRSIIVATSRAFADASFAGLDEGALVVYVADRRTWARRLRCVPR